MKTEQILSAIKFPVSFNASGILVNADGFKLYPYQYTVIAAAINSLQEKEGGGICQAEIIGESCLYPLCTCHEIKEQPYVTICNELGDKPKSAQEVTDQESPSTPSEEEWKEALEARIKNTKANLREAHLIKIGAEWAKKFLNK
jgi:hypothetical protein